MSRNRTHKILLDQDLLATKESPIFSGVVNFTELLGEVTQIYFEPEGDGAPIIAKLPGIVHDLRGNRLNLNAAADKVHLFASGNSLLYR